jgi:hypothetical protein
MLSCRANAVAGEHRRDRGSTELQVQEKAHQLIRRSVARRCPCRLLEAGQSGLLHRQMGLDVAMPGWQALMPQSERYHAEGGAGVQDIHGGGVPYRVRMVLKNTGKIC